MATSMVLAEQIQEDYLTCSICFNYFTRPKALPCLHTFCEGCLQDYYNRHGTGEQFLCPSCRRPINMPEGGIAAFPDNHIVTSLADAVAGASVQIQPGLQEDAAQTQVMSTGKGTTLEQRNVPPIPGSIELPPPAYGDAPPSYNSVVSKTKPSRPPTRQNTGIALQGPEGLILKCGQYGHDNSQMINPVGLAVTREGDLVVSDAHNNKVLIYSKQGQPRLAFLCDNNIRGIAMTGNDDIAIAVHGSDPSLFKICSKNGQVVKTVGDKYTFEKPYGIAVNSMGYVMTVSPDSNSVVVLNRDNKLVEKVSQQFSTPYYIASNSKNEILISDFGHHCIRVFDASSKMKLRIGQKGENRGELKHPMGICVTKQDRIIVADADNHRVQLFSSNGRFKDTLVANTDENGHNIKPRDVAVTSDGNLAVLLTGEEFAEIRLYKMKNYDDGWSFACTLLSIL